MDFALYALIGIAMYSGVIWLTDQGQAGGRSFSWFIASLFTALVFGQVAASYIHNLRRFSFWLMFAVLFAGHVGVFYAFLHLVERINAVSWAVIYVVESSAIAWVLDLYGFGKERPRASES